MPVMDRSVAFPVLIETTSRFCDGCPTGAPEIVDDPGHIMATWRTNRSTCGWAGYRGGMICQPSGEESLESAPWTRPGPGASSNAP